MEQQFGQYHISKKIASGGMAEVFLAHTSGVDGFERPVALKVIHEEYGTDNDFVQMLIEEAKLSVQLLHGNIVHVFDLGQSDGRYYLAMEFVDGVDLFNLMVVCAERGWPIDIDLGVYITAQICAALDYAHNKQGADGKDLNIVHRDVSPQNILISTQGEVKLCDFGIARAESRAARTKTGTLKGKFYYMSPEQAWGRPLDQRTDVFSLGVCLYETIAGQMLYTEEDPAALLRQVRKANIPPLHNFRPEIPVELDEIIMKALAWEPEFRWKNAKQFQEALDGYLRQTDNGPVWQKLAQLVVKVKESGPPQSLEQGSEPRPQGNQWDTPNHLSQRGQPQGLPISRQQPDSQFSPRENKPSPVVDATAVLDRTKMPELPPEDTGEDFSLPGDNGIPHTAEHDDGYVHGGGGVGVGGGGGGENFDATAVVSQNQVLAAVRAADLAEEEELGQSCDGGEQHDATIVGIAGMDGVFPWEDNEDTGETSATQGEPAAPSVQHQPKQPENPFCPQQQTSEPDRNRQSQQRPWQPQQRITPSPKPGPSAPTAQPGRQYRPMVATAQPRLSIDRLDKQDRQSDLFRQGSDDLLKYNDLPGSGEEDSEFDDFDELVELEPEPDEEFDGEPEQEGVAPIPSSAQPDYPNAPEENSPSSLSPQQGQHQGQSNRPSYFDSESFQPPADDNAQASSPPQTSAPALDDFFADQPQAQSSDQLQHHYSPPASAKPNPMMGAASEPPYPSAASSRQSAQTPSAESALAHQPKAGEDRGKGAPAKRLTTAFESHGLALEQDRLKSLAMRKPKNQLPLLLGGIAAALVALIGLFVLVLLPIIQAEPAPPPGLTAIRPITDQGNQSTQNDKEAANLGTVLVVSTPSDALVILDSRERGNTPLTLRVAKDKETRIIVRRPGYMPSIEVIETKSWKDQEKITLDVELKVRSMGTK